MPVPEGLYTVPAIGRFGAWRVHGRHRGVDQYARAGTVIRAAADGVVTSIGYNPDTINGFGHWIRYRHDDGHTILEAHMLSRPAISVGQRFTRGKLLGRVGATGNAWAVGAHSHVEIRRPSGTLIDPTPYLRSLEPDFAVSPPATTNPFPTDEESIKMDRQIHFMKDGRIAGRAVLNLSSGFFMPWTGGAEYANAIAAVFETGSSAEVTESLFVAFQKACAEVRAA